MRVSGVRVTLDILDEHHNSASERFVIRGPRLSGLSGVDGTGFLAAHASGSAEYTFLPTVEAAPVAPALYFISGSLRYVEAGTEVVVPLYSVGITVFPDARLHLLYFQQREVYGDDPFTEETEPSEPFALGLIAKNHGAGYARNFRITSAQPTIIENEKGLLIDFKIIGTQVGDQPSSPSLTATLGTIAPGQSQEAIWWFTSSLQGKFVEYNATFEHVDAFGATNISLVEQVEVHELIRPVRANRPKDDTLPDFLVNDLPDPDNMPDMLYMSDGTVALVNLASNAQTDRTPAPGNMEVRLTANVPSGWVYLRVPNPGHAYRLAKVIRSDGLELRVGDNVWTTDRTFPASQAGARREFTLHLLDYDSTGSYTLRYQIDDRVAPRILAIDGLGQNPQPAPVASLDVEFSEPIDLSTFDHQDIVLTWNGGPDIVSPDVTVSLLTNNTYRISGLQPLTSRDGNYELTIVGAGISDFAGNATANSFSVRWAMGLHAPVVADIVKVLPNPRNTPVSSIDVVFSKPVNLLTFDRHDITLSCSGGPDLINDSVAVVALSPTTFRVAGLTILTQQDGVYRFEVNADGIADESGIPGIGSLSESWVMTTTGPRLLAIERIATNPRNIVVQSLDVTFADRIDPVSFDYRDVMLTRDGGPNLILPEVKVERITDTIYRISNFSWVCGQEGTYTLTVSAEGIRDLAGNPGSGFVSETWIMDTGRPTAPSNLYIVPDLGISATDAITCTNRIELRGSVEETDVAVLLYDTTAALDLGEATVSGTNFAAVVTFASPGSHRIRARTIDPAGNTSADTFLTVFIDSVPPVAAFEPVTPDPRTNAVPTVVVSFSEPIVEATLDTSDLVLTRNDGRNLLSSSLPIAGLGNNTFLLGGLAALTSQPGAYRLKLLPGAVQDIAGNANTTPAEVTWFYQAPNRAPALAPIPDRIVGPLTALVFTNSATDPDFPPNKLRFALGPGAPSGASIDPDTGVFFWVPSREQAPGTYRITVVVTDDGLPPLIDSTSFTVGVTHYIELAIGEAVMRAGTRATLPIHLVSSGSVTNLAFELSLSSERLTDLSIQPLRSEVLASIDQQSPTRYVVVVRAVPGASIKGDQFIAVLGALASPDHPSEIVQIEPRNVQFEILEPPGTGWVFSKSGRAYVIHREPILAAEADAGEGPRLILYGDPGSTCQLQYSSALGRETAWTDWLQVAVQNLEPVYAPVPLSDRALFFRAFVLP